MEFHEKTAVYLSASRDITVNLAIEERLLQIIPENHEILFLYENDLAVVIGRFQNPWKECRTGLARRDAIPLRRRISGGGTVVHSTGNLNFSIISGRRIPGKEMNLDRVIRALRTLGLAVNRNPRFDLVADRPDGGGTRSCKVSGSAFRQTSKSSMHHATLLVNADLSGLKELLHVPERQIESRGVPSIPSPVTNLADSDAGLTAGIVAEALVREWGAEPATLLPETFNGNAGFTESLERLASPDWIWGRTPFFRERFTNLKGMETDVLELAVREGRIETAGWLNHPRANGSEYSLKGLAYHGPDILASAESSRSVWLNDLAARVDGDFLAPGPKSG